MDKCTHEVRMQYWKEIILQCQKRQPGMSVKSWLKENGISEPSYYGWLKKIRLEAYEQLKQNEKLPVVQDNEVTFAEINVSKSTENNTMEQLPNDSFNSTAIIKTSCFSIALTNDISNNLLSKILEEVKHV